MTKSNAKFELLIPVAKAGPGQAFAFYSTWGVLGLGSSYLLFHVLNAYAAQHAAVAGWVHLVQFVIAVFGGLFYVYVPYQVALSRTQESMLQVNQDGIGLPSTFFGLGSPTWIAWSDIARVNLGRSATGKPSLQLNTRWTCKYVKLSAVSRQDLEQILLALEAFAPSAVWSTPMLEFRDNLQSRNSGEDGFSQTQLFEDELSKRFSAPTFVPLEPGRVLRSGTIEVVRQIAFGGFAAIYLARDAVNGTVVLKESVAPTLDNDALREKANELFAREALLLQGLDHPDIARVFDFFVENDRSYIVMEFVDGINLRQLVVQRGPQEEALVLGWAHRVASILVYLHEQSPPIVHRDVTPDNIVLTNTGQIKLIDFGASNQFLGKATGTLVGKHAYMPPEQIRGKAEPASDVFALGASMHYLLTGEEPLPLSVSQPAQVNPNLSATINDIVSRATQLDLSKRTSTAIELAKQIYDVSPKIGSEIRAT